jgi:hypothetical protein
VLQFFISTHLVYYFIVVTLICIGCDSKVSREVISFRFRFFYKGYNFVWRKSPGAFPWGLDVGLAVLGRTRINLCVFSLILFISFTSFVIYFTSLSLFSYLFKLFISTLIYLVKSFFKRLF